MTDDRSAVDTQAAIAHDLSAIARISSVPSILRVVSEMTGLRFVTIARVTKESWTACAVLDKIDFGLGVGGELDVTTTLCSEVRDCRRPIVIDQATADARYRDHRTPKMYGFESYIAVPIFRASGEYFGNLCALDPLPAKVSEPKVVSMLELFAQLISSQLEAEEQYGQREMALLNERETAELREQFIAVLGHDLRTPLSAILHGAEALRRIAPDPRAAPILERVRRSCGRISQLVDDVLDFARGRLGGGIPLAVREVKTLGDDLRHVVAELESAYPGRAINAAIDITASVFCDRARVAQLLSNLLANALTHGAPDTPVAVTAATRDGAFSLSVTNQGTPIPAETRSRLFQPYWRATKGAAQGGLGLGLYIAAEIARSHGGTLDVNSSAAGTTFTFRIPATTPT
jgi:signal transduction histidine kinase